MALQFNPPEWMIQEYMKRKSPALEASEGISQALDSYATYKQQQATQQNAGIKTYVDAFGAGGPQFATDVASRIGLKNPPALPSAQPPTASTGTVATPDLMPTGLEEAAQQSIQGEHPSAPMSPIVQASLAAGHPNHAGFQLPGGEDPVMLAGMGKYGKDRIATLEGVQKLKDAQTAHQEKTGKKMGVTDEQILESGFDPVNQIRVSPKAATPEDREMAKLKAKLTKERPKAKGSLNDAVRQYDALIAEAKAIREDHDLSSATGVLTPMAHINGTGARRVASRIETLKSKTLLNTLGSLKSLSTNGSSGFGALSEKEGEALRNAVTTLDRGQSTKDFQDSLDRLIQDAQFHKQNLLSTYKDTYGEEFSPSLSSAADPSAGGSTAAQTVKSQAEYDALPSGAEYLSADGVPHRKK